MSQRDQTPVPELRVGVVGIGQRAPMAALANVPGVARVVSCADPDPRGRADALKLFGPDVVLHERYEKMADDGLDAVFVLTPDYVHTQPALFFLAAGVPVFVEKPLAISVEDCDTLLEAAHDTRSRLYVGHNLRHLPVLRRMREMIDDGAIGQVRAVWCRHFVGHGGDYYFKDWHAERANTTGLLLQKGAHDLDVIHWLAGGYSRSVVAQGDLAVYGGNPRRGADDPVPADGRMPDWFDPEVWPPSALRELNPVVDVEDISMMLARLDNGVLASYQQCHFTPDYWRNYTVIGDEGRLENFGDGMEGDPATIQVWNRHRSGYRRDADLTVAVDTPSEDDHGGADRALVDEFLRFAAAGGPTETSPVAAREAVAAAVAATASLRSGGTPVDVSPPAPAIADYFREHQPAGPRG
ncbi:Gfo/Idh/MocA family protein [Streptomyces olivaceus]|uniref:Gfo/Idh/MocA family protein n=1 Tax=Streptomyces olivaceus TaxID=47716 RepID=UPI001CCCB039|nr:Gfo/Idh/MocA family oxidoreductase [Streptomyces olivaceus]MBZ6135899.1 Gfo/Idh/MocA family oxidoreductase [Streptomyces olivaceus]MBZ6164103.1 Gfo/Idh/MocA family oxidoreductase [Streptomyces olivaceus]